MDNKITKFVVMDHNAIKAGPHQDLRWRIPGSHMWESFAMKKGIPLVKGKKHLAIQTKKHNEYGATFTGEVKRQEYGRGTLELFDSGKCTILKQSSRHIVINFEGKKVKGIYHMVVVAKGKKEGYNDYLIFRGK